jgi:hypothetical protein
LALNPFAVTIHIGETMPFHFCHEELRLLLLAIPFAGVAFAYLKDIRL